MTREELNRAETAELLGILLQDEHDEYQSSAGIESSNPDGARPRENLAVFAPEQLAEKLLKHFPDLNTLSSFDADAFKHVDGITETQTRRLLAAFELGWRAWMKPAHLSEPFFGSRQVFNAFREVFAREPVEVVWLLLLDTRLRQKAALELARGALNGAIIHPREVFHHIVRYRAAAFVLMHNHPSGDPQPSREDVTMTHKLHRLSRLFAVDFLDHVIFTPGDFYSLADHGLLRG